MMFFDVSDSGWVAKIEPEVLSFELLDTNFIFLARQPSQVVPCRELHPGQAAHKPTSPAFRTSMARGPISPSWHFQPITGPGFMATLAASTSIIAFSSSQRIVLLETRCVKV